MRIDLRCPYAERQDAKLLGARWDAARKVWYIVDVEDLTPFMRWIPSERQNPGKIQKGQNSPKFRAKKRAVSGMTFAITHSNAPQHSCDCDALPWEDCEHTEALADKAMREIMTLPSLSNADKAPIPYW